MINKLGHIVQGKGVSAEREGRFEFAGAVGMLTAIASYHV
jgi:hypothetical protein